MRFRPAYVTRGRQVLGHVAAHLDRRHLIHFLPQSHEHRLNAAGERRRDKQNLILLVVLLRLQQVNELLLECQRLLPSKISKRSVKNERVLEAPRVPVVVVVVSRKSIQSFGKKK